MTPNFIAQGIDYAWGRPRYSDLKANGVKFVMRYISHDSAKDLLEFEKKQLDAVGVRYGLVFETTAGRARGGFGAGAADAKSADARSKSLGLPDIPVYFAVDFDASGPEIAAYIRGAASVLGAARTGVYGGYKVVSYCFNQSLCQWFWQTYAWSGGAVFGRLKALLAKPKRLRAIRHPEAHVYQYQNGVTVAGVSADWNKATAQGLQSLRPAPKPTGPSLAYLKRRLAIRKKDLRATQKREAYIQSRITVLEKKIADAAGKP